MFDDEFEWDDAKAETNFEKHAVRFDDARRAFRDPLGVEFEDDRSRYGEPRFVLIGRGPGGLLTVVYAERHGRIRLISARRATRLEQERYHAQD
jgi:uncharacterized DUF497 family protein